MNQEAKKRSAERELRLKLAYAFGYTTGILAMAIVAGSIFVTIHFVVKYW